MQVVKASSKVRKASSLERVVVAAQGRILEPKLGRLNVFAARVKDG